MAIHLSLTIVSLMTSNKNKVLQVPFKDNVFEFPTERNFTNIFVYDSTDLT